MRSSAQPSTSPITTKEGKGRLTSSFTGSTGLKDHLPNPSTKRARVQIKTVWSP
jgi:hypothetical protein